MRELIQEHISSSAHLAKKHVHPRLMKMLEMGGMAAVFTRAEGQYLWDTQDQRYLDFLAGGGVFFLGRNHPKIREALADVVAMDLPNLCVVNASVLGGLLAERLIEIGGPHFTKVVYANSGAEAIEVCIRFTRYMTRRRRFLFEEGAFHGRTYGAISLCGFEQMKDGMDPKMPVCTPVRRNDLKMLRAELSKGDVAAMFVEPVQGMTCEVLDPGYLREAESLCAQYGTVFVCDEIQTGLGRAGAWFASRELGLKPGMMTVSKTLAGGHVPVSAVLMSEEVYKGVYEKFKAGPIYFSTFAENNLAMAAGLATLEALKELDAPARARKLGERLRNGVEKLAEKYDCIDRVTGKGLFLAIYFKTSDKTKLRLQQELMAVADKGGFAAAMNVDLYTRQRVLVQIPGPELNGIKILPPVVSTEADVSYFLGAFEDTLAHFYGSGGPVVSLGAAVVKDALRSVRKMLPGGGAAGAAAAGAASASAGGGGGAGSSGSSVGTGGSGGLEAAVSAPEETPEKKSPPLGTGLAS